MIAVAANLFVFAAALPIGLVGHWWDRHYGLSRRSYGSFVGEQAVGLAVQTATIAIVLAIVAGILLIALGPSHHVRAGVVWGLLTGVTIASYTLWDNHSVTALAVPPVPTLMSFLNTSCAGHLSRSSFSIALSDPRPEMSTLGSSHGMSFVT